VKKLTILFFTSLLCLSLHAEKTYRNAPYQDIRWLGRGNTGVAVVRDASAMFYNPAGLGRSGRYAFDFGNFAGGISESTYGNSKAVSTVGSSSSSLSDKFSPFLGEPLSVNAQLFPAFAVPFVGLGAFFTMEGRAEYRNPVSPEFSFKERDDVGLIGGIGVPVFPGLYVGASFRYFKRRVIEEEITGSSLLTLTASDLTDYARRGSGYGLNVGAQFDLPLAENSSLNFGFSVEDLGNTRIHSSKEDGPLDQDQSINLGVAYSFESDHLGAKILFDARNLGEGDYYSTGKLLYQGIEINLAGLDLRGGFYHGYWSAGVSIRWIPIMRIDFTSYAEELDSNLGFRANRVYMVGINMGMSLESLGGKKQKYSLDDY